MPPAKYNKAIIAFGGNMGHTRRNIAQAIIRLEEIGAVEKISPFFITEPEGHQDQPDFLNGVLMLKTELGPLDLLAKLKEIETALGRVTTFPNGPREIDLDIIFYNDIILRSDALTIPHPRAAEREFVLLPLSFIEPDFINPLTKETVARTLKNLIRNKYFKNDKAKA